MTDNGESRFEMVDAPSTWNPPNGRITELIEAIVKTPQGKALRVTNESIGWKITKPENLVVSLRKALRSRGALNIKCKVIIRRGEVFVVPVSGKESGNER